MVTGWALDLHSPGLPLWVSFVLVRMCAMQEEKKNAEGCSLVPKREEAKVCCMQLTPGMGSRVSPELEMRAPVFQVWLCHQLADRQLSTLCLSFLSYVEDCTLFLAHWTGVRIKQEAVSGGLQAVHSL